MLSNGCLQRLFAQTHNYLTQIESYAKELVNSKKRTVEKQNEIQFNIYNISLRLGYEKVLI
jgi:hypothetical protein